MTNQEVFSGMIDGGSALTGGESSNMALNRPDDSEEQIALLPETAFTNNM